MSTTMTPTDSEAFTSTLSSEGYELIQSYYYDVSRVVYQLAEAIARKRTGITSPNVVSIEEQDVRQAGQRILQLLRSAVSSELQDAINELDLCVNSN